jgi:hypothetical protein
LVDAGPAQAGRGSPIVSPRSTASSGSLKRGSAIAAFYVSGHSRYTVRHRDRRWIAGRQRETRRGRSRSGWGRPGDRDYGGGSAPARTKASLAQASVVVRRSPGRRPSATQPTARRACARSPGRRDDAHPRRSERVRVLAGARSRRRG